MLRRKRRHRKKNLINWRTRSEPLFSLKMYEHWSFLEDDNLAARCLTLNSYLIDRYFIRPKLRDVMWSTTVIIKGMASANVSKETVSVFSSYPLFKDGSVRFITIPLKALSDQEWSRYSWFLFNKLEYILIIQRYKGIGYWIVHYIDNMKVYLKFQRQSLEQF